ncbi:ribonuclease E inhibitor RraB [Dielma fastidiosa]|uniref:Regulator of ribonuclease activity B n=1 Tax=Dielma fastidiosa TaxID=1034346 RepID=A0A318KV04_9FIRM|nr:ribonuclease E inhibitor RraB [Dielma fastidiosa]PXX81449.1 regulator of ribonuclease activity B [Dielma fastidiosa]
MKKALTTIAILGGIAAAVAYKLKKDEEKKIMKLEQELLDEENSTENHEAEADQEACCCEAEPEAACSCAEESCGCDESCTCEEGCACEDEAACSCGDEEACACETEKCEAADPQYPYLSADDKKRIDEINQEVIANLEENGDVHENERPVQHTVVFTNLDDLENYKTAVINKGFVVTKGEGALELYVLHIAPIDRIQLIQNIYYLANLALEMHGVYKGWKSRVSY